MLLIDYGAGGAIDATCSMYTDHRGTMVLSDSYLSSVRGMVVGVPAWGAGRTLSRSGSHACRSCATGAGNRTLRLHQAQRAGTGNRFGAPLDLELAKDYLIVPFHRTHGEEQPLADRTIRESLGHELEYF